MVYNDTLKPALLPPPPSAPCGLRLPLQSAKPLTHSTRAPYRRGSSTLCHGLPLHRWATGYNPYQCLLAMIFIVRCVSLNIILLNSYVFSSDL